jgi:hypothetical protein
VTAGGANGAVLLQRALTPTAPFPHLSPAASQVLEGAPKAPRMSVLDDLLPEVSTEALALLLRPRKRIG